MKQWYEIKAQADSKADIWIYEDIGEDFWTGEGISAKRFVAELNGLEAAEIALHINSAGGNVFDGQAIYTALRRHRAQITTYIDGLAASIASVVALAGDEIVMPSNAMLMIHDPWGMVMGFSSDMRQMADTLDKVRDTVLNVYEEHSTKTREELSAAMAAETWFTAADALEFGFIDEVASEMKMAAHFDLSRYQHPPVALTEAPVEEAEPPVDPEQNTAPEVAETPDVAPAEGTDEAKDLVLVPAVGRFIQFPKK